MLADAWIVCGGRDFKDQKLFDAVMRILIEDRGMPELIVHGAAPGADKMAHTWAERFGVNVIGVPADWYDLTHPDAIIETDRRGKQFDRKAGQRRNIMMHMDFAPSLVVAFPGGVGTAGMVFHAVRHGTEVAIVEGGVIRFVKNTEPERFLAALPMPLDVS